MKVKNIWIGLVKKGNIKKIVIVKESGKFKKMLLCALHAVDDEYKCVFTDKSYWFKKEDIYSLNLFLADNQMNKNISRSQLLNFYKERRNQLEEQLENSRKAKIGF